MCNLKIMIDIDIKTILPQKEPFVMISSLLHCDKILTITEFEIRENHIFVLDGVLTEPGIIENIAQTCAARMGYVNSVINKGNVKLGFIGSVKNLVIKGLPHIGSRITTSIEVKNEVFNMLLVKAVVKSNNIEIANCEMKISEQ